MGGRGTVSVTGGKINIGSLGSDGNDILGVGGNPDKREGINTMFVSELGFSSVDGLSTMQTAVLGSYGIALNNLERKYGAISSMDIDIPVLGMNTVSTIAAVRFGNDGKPNGLLISRNKMGKTSTLTGIQRKSEASGFSMPTDGKLTSVARYAITHEYGHLIHSALSMKANKPKYKIAMEVKSLAEKKYGASDKSLSSYGHRNYDEFFAEAFANANSGNPNAIGKAMNDYLQQNSLR